MSKDKPSTRFPLSALQSALSILIDYESEIKVELDGSNADALSAVCDAITNVIDRKTTQELPPR